MKEHYVPTPRPVAVPYALVDDRLIQPDCAAASDSADGARVPATSLPAPDPRVDPPRSRSRRSPPVILAGRAGPFRLSRLEPRAEAESKAVAGAGRKAGPGLMLGFRWLAVMYSTVFGRRMRAPSSSPPFSSICAKRR